MADNTPLDPGAGGSIIRDEDIGGVHFPVAKIVLGNAGVNDGDVSATNPLPVTGIVAVGGPVDQGVGAGAAGFWSVRLSDGAAFYDAPLRAQLPAALVGGRLSVDGSGVTQPVSGPLTDAQLRASAVPVSGPLTDAQLRASAVPVSAAALPLPAGAATEATLAGVATEATLSTLATEATAATLGTEATLANVLTTSAFQARVNTLGQKLMAASMPVAIASDQSPIPVTGTAVVSGPVDQGAGAGAAGSWSVRLSDGAAFYDAPLRAQLPAALVGGRLSVDVGASALPAGAATEATLAGVATEATLGTISGQLPPALSGGWLGVSFEAQAAPLAVVGTVAVSGSVAVTQSTSPWVVDGSGVTQPVSAAALPLPAGAATEVTLATRAAASQLPAALVGGRLSVDGSGVTQPVSGPLTDAQLRASAVPVSGPLTDAQLRAAAVPVSAAALPLPAGAATEATLATLLTTSAFQARVATLGQKLMAGSMPVAIASDQSAIPISGAVTVGGTVAVTQSTSPWVVGDGGGTLTVDAPVGAPVAVRLSDGAAFYDGAKTGQLPAALVGGRLSVDGSGVTQPVSGPLTDAQLRATAVPVSGPLTDAQLRAAVVPVSIGAALPAGANTIGKVDQGAGGASAWKVDGSAVTQPVSAAALPLPTGAATSALQGTAFDLDTGGGVQNVAGASLRLSFAGGSIEAKGQKVSADSIPVVIASNQPQFPISISLVNAGDGGTASNPLFVAYSSPPDVAVDTWLGSNAPTVGQKVMASSLPVTIASNQSALPVTDNAGSLTVDAPVGTPVAVRLSDGAAFYDGTKTGQLPAALVGGRVDSNVGAWLGSTAPTVGSKTSANSVPVVIASDQGAVAVTPPALTKGTQGATGVSTQDLKDAGRTRVVISFEAVAPAVADTLLTLVKKKDGVAAAGTTTIPVTAGKTLRITAVSFSVKAGAAAAAFATLTLRENPAGATVIGSPTWGRIDIGNTAAVIGAADKVVLSFPDGIEFSGVNQIGASASAQAVTNILSVEMYGFEY